MDLDFDPLFQCCWGVILLKYKKKNVYTPHSAGSDQKKNATFILSFFHFYKVKHAISGAEDFYVIGHLA